MCHAGRGSPTSPIVACNWELIGIMQAIDARPCRLPFRFFFGTGLETLDRRYARHETAYQPQTRARAGRLRSRVHRQGHLGAYQSCAPLAREPSGVVRAVCGWCSPWRSPWQCCSNTSAIEAFTSRCLVRADAFSNLRLCNSHAPYKTEDRTTSSPGPESWV